MAHVAAGRVPSASGWRRAVWVGCAGDRSAHVSPRCDILMQSRWDCWPLMMWMRCCAVIEDGVGDQAGGRAARRGVVMTGTPLQKNELYPVLEPLGGHRTVFGSEASFMRRYVKTENMVWTNTGRRMTIPKVWVISM